MFIFIDDEEFDAYELEAAEVGIKIGTKEHPPYCILWLEDNGVHALKFKGQVLVAERYRVRVLEMLHNIDFGKVCTESDILSLHLLKRMRNKFNKMWKEENGSKKSSILG